MNTQAWFDQQRVTAAVASSRGTLRDNTLPLALLFICRLVKVVAPVSVCAPLPLKVQVPVPELNVPLLEKLPPKFTTGLLVVPA